MSAYSAPLNVYKPLFDSTVSHPGDTVCLGKEWYRFPSSFNLPQGVRAKFIKSEFSGLLPGEFSEADASLGLFPGTWLIPSGMNDENLEDLSKYVCELGNEDVDLTNLTKQTDLEQCDFIVDTRSAGAPPTALEPDYISDTEHWEALKCLPFLDASKTHTISRMLWVPDLSIIPAKFRRQWGDYCLLQRKDPKGA